MPGLIAAASAFPVVSARYQPYIASDNGGLGLALARPRRESDQLDLAWLLVRARNDSSVNGQVARSREETGIVSDLTQAICRDAVETGMVSVFARIPEECAHLGVFHNLGFTIVVREHTYMRPASGVPKPGELPNLRRQEGPDAWSVQQLYRACTPASVQTAENLTSRTWEPPRRRFAGMRGDTESDSFVMEDKHGIIAWLRIDRAHDEPYRFSLMVQPGNRDAAPRLVDFALNWLSDYPRKAVVVSVRDYESGAIAALEESGFKAIYARILMVRNLGIRFADKVKAPALGRVPN